MRILMVIIGFCLFGKGSSFSTTPYTIPSGPRPTVRPRQGGNRIVGGVRASMTPFMAALEVTDKLACGASIIDQWWLLCAAHCCIWSVSTMRVRVGTVNLTSGALYEVAQKIMHPQYSNVTAANDICLFRLKKPLVLSSSVQPIPMCASFFKLVVGEPAKIFGWGRISEDGASSDQLLAGEVKILGAESCRTPYGSIFTDDMICAADPVNWAVDTCQGDSGGPLVVRGCQAGVVSWGGGCARKDQPGVYTSVPNYCQWIAASTGLTQCAAARSNRMLLVPEPGRKTIMRPAQISLN